MTLRYITPLIICFFISFLNAQNTVVINELMASNDVSVADQDGEYDDWAELFNMGSESVNLSGYFLTDDPEDLMKWQFPEGTIIEAEDYLIIWVDDDEEQEGLHTPFKLAAAGESLHLVDPNGNILDEVVFGEQTTDLSYARQPNGTGNFVIKAHTFNANNNSTSGIDYLVNDNSLKLFPNPVSEILTIEMLDNTINEMDIKMYDVFGRQILETHSFGKKVQMDVSNLSSGFYFIKVNEAYISKISIR